MKSRAGLVLAVLFVFASARGQMTSNQVATILEQALTRGNYFVTNGTASNAVVAIVDREGFVLAVRSLLTNPAPTALNVVDAITKAGTAAFLSSDQEALSSRTAGYIVQQHFPPGIRNAPPGPLVGVNFSNLSFSDVNHFKDPHTYDPTSFGGGGTNGAPIAPLALAALTGLAGSPGGVPLYANGRLLGGVGAVLTGKPPIPEIYDIQQSASQRYDVDEDVSLAGQTGFEPSNDILGSLVFVAGLRLPYVNSTTRLSTNQLLGSMGFVVSPYEISNSPAVHYPPLALGGVPGELRAPIIGDPSAGTIQGEPRLTAAEVTNILTLAAQRAAITRAGIRLPAGQSAQVFISVVNNPGVPGVAPAVLGTFRTADATVFSWDVSVQKARTALYFSSTNFFSITNPAFSTRTVGFLAQSLYPPGINKTRPGPFLGLQESFSLLPLATPLVPSGAVTNVLDGVVFTTNDLPAAVSAALPNGITIFPGGFPLYRNGVLVGAIGVSGDGVDQDDLISASGTINFLAPAGIRADQIIFRSARLPYAKFPRNPTL